MKPTPQQIDFINAVLEGEENVTLVARAGTGKTSTIIKTVEACVAQDPRRSTMLFAYNKSIETELSARLSGLGIDPNVARAKTAHAAGLSLVTTAFGRVAISDKKVANILRDVSRWSGPEQYVIDQYFPQICKLIGYAKSSGFGHYADLGVDDDEAWYAVADHFGINGVDDESQMLSLFDIAKKAYARSLDITQEVDFDDMILLPLIKNLKVRYPSDRVFVDEAQDLSRARQDLVKKFIRSDVGRMYIVGDDRQAIYGFSGADAQALANLTQSLKALELPLTVTWRCARSIVEAANQYVPDLEAAPNAVEGSVTSGALPSDLRPGDAILCRFNAPLMTQAFALIRQGIACKVEGRDIGKGLTKLVRRWKTRDIGELLDRLDQYKENEIRKAQARGSDTKIQAINDQVDTLVEICHGVQQKGRTSTDDVAAAIENLFGDDINPKQCVVLSSVHKAKGREWDRVAFLDKPVKRQLQDWEKLQEQNLRYVAITRAKSNLRFVPIE